MTKKLSSFILCASMLLTAAVPTVFADAQDDDQPIYYVKQGSTGVGTEDSPFGTVEEALEAIGSLDAKIMIDGTYDITKTVLKDWKGLVNVTGEPGSIIVCDENTSINIPGKIVFENINFDLGDGSSFMCGGKSIEFDIGKNSFDGTVYLSSSNFAGYAICSDITVESGNVEKVVLGNSDASLDKYASSGTVDINVQGGKISELVLSPDNGSTEKYTVSGNLNVVCSDGGKIESITCNEGSSHIIKGAVSLIFNEGVGIPEAFAYPEAEQGVYIITTEEGGDLYPTGNIGIYDIKPNVGKALAMNGTVLNVSGTVTVTPAKYEFGWENKSIFDNDTDVKIIAEPVVIYYDPNGGINPPAAKESVKGLNINLSTKIPENEGFKFMGWSLDKNATVAEYQPGESFKCEDNVSLYAVWEKTTEYTLSFSADGATDIPEAKTVEIGNSVTINEKIPRKTGHKFLGWATSATSEKVKYNPGDKLTLTKDTTLYAVWEQSTEIILIIDSKEATVSGVKVENDVPPIIENDRTMLPARFVAENLGAKVEWDDTSRAVVITTDDTEILIAVDSDTAYVNGKKTTLDSPAFIRDDRTYTPVRFICESLGANVEWDDAERKVTITK